VNVTCVTLRNRFVLQRFQRHRKRGAQIETTEASHGVFLFNRSVG